MKSKKSDQTKKKNRIPAAEPSTKEPGAGSINPPAMQLKASKEEKSNREPEQLSSKNALPFQLKNGIESLSGVSMNDVNVEYNSSDPAQLQAHAYAQGNNIKVAPGQEKHLPHEAWHIVQQKQGRVQETAQQNGVGINNNPSLEKEADQMGEKAAGFTGEKIAVSGDSSSQGAVAPFQLKPKNPFKRLAYHKKRKKDKSLKGGLEEFESGTASDVYKVETQGPIGKTGTNKGFAKKALTMDSKKEANATLDNLGLKDDENKKIAPNLIARQVVSSRIDKALGFNILSDEAFSKDEDKKTIGVSGRVGGQQVMEGEIGEVGGQTGTIYNKINEFDLSKSNTKRDLSKLQLIDALTDQRDRHAGNMFIDRETGAVKGIDNDMAFGVDNAFDVNGYTNQLSNQFKFNDDGKLEYLQEHVDEAAANAVLDMSEKDYLKILKGRITDPEKLDKKAIGFAMMRFKAIKEKLQTLKNEEKLISDWDTVDTDELIESGLEQSKYGDYKHKSYISRIHDEYHNKGKDSVEEVNKTRGANLRVPAPESEDVSTDPVEEGIFVGTDGPISQELDPMEAFIEEHGSSPNKKKKSPFSKRKKRKKKKKPREKLDRMEAIHQINPFI